MKSANKPAAKSKSNAKAGAKASSKPAAKSPAKAGAKSSTSSAKPGANGAAKPAAASPVATKPAKASSAGTPDKPWKLKTPPGASAFEAYRDEAAAPPALVVQVGSTQLRYQLSCIDDLHAMLRARGDWMPLGGADENKPAADGTVEAWGRSPKNPVGGWYGLKKNLRGRFGVYVPPVLEALGLAEVEHAPKNNRMRAI
jgi:hypothetical protein